MYIKVFDENQKLMLKFLEIFQSMILEFQFFFCFKQEIDHALAVQFVFATL